MTVAETAEAPLSPHRLSYILAGGIPFPFRSTRFMTIVRVIHLYRAARQSPLTQTVSSVTSFLLPCIIVCFDGSHRWSLYAYRSIQPQQI
jgi:hypothetical protein